MVTDEFGNKLEGFYMIGFFEKGKIAKHTISRFHFKSEIDKFRKELNFVKYQPINNTIN